jgi:hypothetical protein
MKKILFLPLVLITCLSFAQDAKEIIGKPFKIGNLLVAENDFPEAMNWDDAKEACRALGKSWRLPSKTELNILYKNRKKIGGFSDYFYWSSTEPIRGIVWQQYFYNGCQSLEDIRYGLASDSPPTLYVRAVRTIK